MQAIDYENFYADGGTGWGGPTRGVPTVGTTSNPPVYTAGTPTQAVPAFDMDSIGRIDQTADDLMDDWESWMYPELQEGLFRDKQVREHMINSGNRGGELLDALGHSTADIARRMNDLNNHMYIPQAQRIMADAQAFDRAGYAERAAKTAIGDMGAAFANDRDAARMRNAQYGIDPTSGRAMAQDRIAQIMHGANVSSAANRARSAAEEIWGKKQMDAMNTSGILNANTANVGQLYNNSAGMFTGATGLRKLGMDATNQYFTNMRDLATTRNQLGQTVGGLRNDAGNLRLGLYKTNTDRDTTRYGIDKSLEGQKYSADKQAQSSQAAANAQKSSSKSNALGTIIGAGLAIF